MRTRLVPLLLLAGVLAAGEALPKWKVYNDQGTIPLKFSGQTRESHEKDLRAFVARDYPGFDLDSPSGRLFLDMCLIKIRRSHKRPDQCCLNARDWQAAGDNLAFYRSLVDALAGNGMPEAWNLAMAERWRGVIREGAFLDGEAELALVEKVKGFAKEAVVVGADDLGAALAKHLPGLADLEPLARLRVWLLLAELSPAVRYAGWTVVPVGTKAEPSTCDLPIDGGLQRHRFDTLAGPAPVPPTAVLQDTAGAPRADEYRYLAPTVETAAGWNVARLVLAGDGKALPERVEVTVHLDDDGTPRQAWALTPELNNLCHVVHVTTWDAKGQRLSATLRLQLRTDLKKRAWCEVAFAGAALEKQAIAGKFTGA